MGVGGEGGHCPCECDTHIGAGDGENQRIPNGGNAGRFGVAPVESGQGGRPRPGNNQAIACSGHHLLPVPQQTLIGHQRSRIGPEGIGLGRPDPIAKQANTETQFPRTGHQPLVANSQNGRQGVGSANPPGIPLEQLGRAANRIIACVTHDHDTGGHRGHAVPIEARLAGVACGPTQAIDTAGHKGGITDGHEQARGISHTGEVVGFAHGSGRPFDSIGAHQHRPAVAHGHDPIGRSGHAFQPLGRARDPRLKHFSIGPENRPRLAHHDRPVPQIGGSTQCDRGSGFHPTPVRQSVRHPQCAAISHGEVQAIGAPRQIGDGIAEGNGVGPAPGQIGALGVGLGRSNHGSQQDQQETMPGPPLTRWPKGASLLAAADDGVHCVSIGAQERLYNVLQSISGIRHRDLVRRREMHNKGRSGRSSGLQ